MQKKWYRAVLMTGCLLAVIGLGTLHYREEQKKIPDYFLQTRGEAVPRYESFWITGSILEDSQEAAASAYASKGYTISYKYLGLIPIREAHVEVVEPDFVIAGGIPVGIYMETDGILVIGTGTVAGADGLNYEPAYQIVQGGDYIRAVNGHAVMEKEDLIAFIQETGGEPVTLELERGGKVIQTELKAVKTNTADYKLGIWVRDNTQGVGTITFLTGSGQFGALGHGLSDVDTGELLKLSEGKLYDTTIIEIKKGEKGSPGELSGLIRYRKNLECGTLTENTAVGIFGEAAERLYEKLPKEKIQIGYKQEVELGEAFIRSYISGAWKDYRVEIEEIHCKDTDLNRGIVLRVVDEELLELTGGIVQGMSGSPIIQDGKIVGAVTHVLVNDPTRGYGIFIENMLDAAD